MKSKIVPVRIREIDYKDLERIAKDQGTTVSSLIRKSLYETVLKSALIQRRKQVVSVLRKLREEKKCKAIKSNSG